jgi:hypothetical protein
MSEQLDPEQIRTEAFIGQDDFLCGLKMRPFTMQSLLMCRASGNRLVAGGDVDKIEGIEQDVIGFLYIHAGDVLEVRRACRDKDLFWEKSLEFADKLKFSDFQSIVEKVSAIITEASSGIVEVKSTGQSKPSGN